MPTTEYKVFGEKWEPLLTMLALFIPLPLPQCKYQPDYIINGWGLGYSAAFTSIKIPLGWIIVAISYLTHLIFF